MQVRYGRLLEMNGPEFEDEIQRVLDDNPALDVDDTIADTSAEEFKETAEDIQLADYRDDDIPSYRLEAPGRSDSERTYEPLAADSAQSLFDTLGAQLSEHSLTDTQRSIALYVIGNLDDNGYLTRDAASMAYDIEAHTGLTVTTAGSARMIALVRTMDPPVSEPSTCAIVCSYSFAAARLLLTQDLPLRLSTIISTSSRSSTTTVWRQASE